MTLENRGTFVKIVRNISGCNLKSKIEKIDEKNLV